MSRPETTDEFAARMGPLWFHYSGLPGDPGWVSDGWEHHDCGYDEKIRLLAERWEEDHDPTVQ